MANNNEQSDLGDNKVTGNATQRSAGRGAVDSRALPVLDAAALFNFATICAPAKVGTSANVAAPAELTATDKSAPLEPKDSGESPQLAREASSAATVEQLTNVVEQDRLAAADAAKRYEDQVTASNELRAKIQQLESYIDDRSQSWSVLNAKVAEHKDALASLEATVAAKDAQLAAHTQETGRLTSRIRELERNSAQLTDHGRGREVAHEELQGRLAKQIATVMRLRSELANASTSAAEARAQLAQRREIRTARHAAESALAARVTELEKTLAERQEDNERLQTSHAAADHALRESEQRIAKLEHQLRSAAKETTQLKGEIAAREQLVKRFKGSAQELNRLGASLEGLDRKLSSASTQMLSAQQRLRALRNNAVAVKPVDGVSVAPETPCRKMIVAVDGEDRVNYPLGKNDMTIGRAPASDIMIPRDYVSRTHARIFMRGDSTFIEDLGSRNGVFVNYKAIKQSTELHDGDVIGLGEAIDVGEPELKYIDLDRPATSGRTRPASPRVTRTPQP